MPVLALYIDEVLSQFPDFHPGEQPRISLYPSSPPDHHIFDSLGSAPQFDKTKTNRILVYFGCFNPPNRAHLHQLTHVFLRGTYDLNIQYALIVPSTDELVSRKKKAEDANFMFSLDERCVLWRRDLCFPLWAWVFNQNIMPFSTFWKRLYRAIKRDGISLEMVPLCGPGNIPSGSPPSPVYCCMTIIMTDASRAIRFKDREGRLMAISGYTKWRAFRDNDRLAWQSALAIARHTLRGVRPLWPHRASGKLEDGMSGE